MVACGGPELRADHAGAFGAAEDAGRVCRRCVDGGVGDFELGVGGEDGGGEGFGVGGGVAERGGGGGDRGEEFFGGERDADDAGGRWEDFVEDAAERARRRRCRI